MWSYRFDIAIKYDFLLYYSRTNTGLCIIGIWQMLYQVMEL